VEVHDNMILPAHSSNLSLSLSLSLPICQSAGLHNKFCFGLISPADVTAGMASLVQ
jgi:hypothetical protein